jgi:DNA helicase IV
VAHPELAAEQAHLDRAHARLDTISLEATEIIEEARAGERGGALFQRFERDAAEALGEARLRALGLGDQALCFGRLDLADEEDPLHIGRLGVLDADGTPLVVDWRAPISALFYRATVGEPLGVLRRRHISARGRRVLDLDDELLDAAGADVAVRKRKLVLVGEAALLSALGRTRRGRMSDIVATIQAEQDAIVRAPLASVLVVQGGPGTGKTAVGLHRVAYLLYSHRLLLERQGVLLVGPNPTFLRYVEHVVPSLGETNLRLATPQDLIESARAASVDPPDVAAVKADARMAQVVANAVAQRQRPLRAQVEVGDGRLILRLRRGTTARIVERARAAGLVHNEARALVERLVVAALWRDRERLVLGDDAGRAPVEPAFAKRMRAHAAVKAALDHVWPIVTPARLVDDLLGTRALLAAAAAGILDEYDVGALLRPRSTEPAWSEHDLPLLDEAAALLGAAPVPLAKRRPPKPVALPGEQDLLDQVLSAEAFGNIEGGVDIHLKRALRDRLLTIAAEDRGAVVEPELPEPAAQVAGHVVVDEAQDVTPMQWRVLARRTSGSSLTLLGDLAQGSHPWSARSWSEVLAHLGRTDGEATVVELGIGYRTPIEVMDLARRVLAAIDPALTAPRAVRSVGDVPRLVDAPPDDPLGPLPELVAAERAALDGGTVAVLCPAEEVAAVAACLDVAPAVGGDALDVDVAVLSAEAAKGLEFDSVVVVLPAGMRLPSLYVALTRTTRRLAVLGRLPLPDAAE